MESGHGETPRIDGHVQATVDAVLRFPRSITPPDKLDTPGSRTVAGSSISARTAAVSAAGQIMGRTGIVVLGVLNTAIVTRSLSISSYAAWATALSLLSLCMALSDPGLSPVVMRWIGHRDLQPPSPFTVLRTRLTLLGIGYIFVILGCWALRGPTAVALGLVLGAQVFPRGVAATAAIWLQAHHRQHRQSLVELITSVVGTGMLAGAAFLDAPAALLGVVGFLLPSLALAAFAQRQLRSIAGIDQYRRSEVRMSVLWREAAPLGAAVVLAAAYTRIDVFFVNLAEPPAGIARYLLAYQFLDATLVISSILAVTLMPLLVRRANRSELLTDPVVSLTVRTIAAIGICMSAAVAALAEPLVLLAGGEQYGGARGLLIVLSPTIAGLFLNFFSGYFYMAVGQGRRYLRINLATFVVNILGNAALTPKYGASAAAQMSWFTELFVVTLNLVPMARKGGIGLLQPLPLLALLVVACETVALLHAPLAVLGVPVIVTLFASRRDLAASRDLVRRRAEPGS